MIQPIQLIQADEDDRIVHVEQLRPIQPNKYTRIVQIEQFVGRHMMHLHMCFNSVFYFGAVRVDDLQFVLRGEEPQPKTLESERDKNILIMRMDNVFITGIDGFADYAQL